MYVIENSLLLDLIDKRIDKRIKEQNFSKEVAAVVVKVPERTADASDTNKIGYAYVRFVNDSEYSAYEMYASNYAYGSGRDMCLINKTGELLSVGDCVWVTYSGLLTADNAYISRRNGVDYGTSFNSIKCTDILEYIPDSSYPTQGAVCIKSDVESSANYLKQCLLKYKISPRTTFFVGENCQFTGSIPTGYTYFHDNIVGNYTYITTNLCNGLTNSSNISVYDSIVFGYYSQINTSQHSMTLGEYNKCNEAYSGSIIAGKNNTISTVQESIITGHYNTCTSSVSNGSILSGMNNNVKSLNESLLEGLYNTVNSLNQSLVCGCNISLSGSVSNSVICGFQHKGESCSDSIVGGYSHSLGSRIYYSLITGKGAVLSDTTNPIVKELENGGVVVGGGGNNAFVATAKGNVYITGQYSSNGADYAESFEWLDGNKNNEDRRGRFVALQGNYIRYANKFDDKEDVLGVISATPSVIGDSHEDEWCDKYETDVFGTPVYVEETEEVQISEDKTETRTVYKKKISENYDENRQYISRSQRPEHDYVGVLGKLIVVDDGTCVENGYCYPSIEGIATKTDDKTKGFKVMKRIDENHIKIWVK